MADSILMGLLICDRRDPENQTQTEEVQNDDSLLNVTWRRLWHCAFVFNLFAVTSFCIAMFKAALLHCFVPY